MTDDVGKLAEKTFVHYYERRRREGGPGTAGYEWGQLTADLQAAGLAIVSSVDSRLTEIDGWKRTALAMRDASIEWSQDGKNRCDEIQRLYFDAAMFKQFSSE